ncbi:MAG: terminase large subunit [Oscillospiraceae bacterium]|nr:terminase large subunit [Oscillospiraceae bacterium]
MDNYILAYYQAITDGSIIAGKKIKAWYKYIVEGLEKKAFFYAPKKAKAAIVYVENFCRHHEGALAPGKIRLELWQKAFLSVVFGIEDEDGQRQFREVFLEVARKAGKTLLAAAIASYATFIDGEYGARVYFAAPKLDQASLCYDAFYQMITKEPMLLKQIKKRRNDIYYSAMNASARPLAFSAKKSDGLNISLGVCDEVASWAGDQGLKFYEVLKSSVGARRQPLLLSLSTAGYLNDGVYDELRKRGTAVLNGTSTETRFAPFLYEIDDVEKWNDINELHKANPNLGVSVRIDYMLEEIRIAEGSISKKAEFLAKYCNVKQSSSQAWFNATDVAACFSEKRLDFEAFRGCYCVIGIDLSQTTDLTACAFVIEKGGKLYTIARFFMPAERIKENQARDNLPYEIYVKRGFLQPSGENFVDYQDCFNWIADAIGDYELYPLRVGYDRYCAQYLIKDLKSYGLQVDDVYQGENLTPVINEVDGLMRDHAFEFGDNDLLKIHLLNAAVKINNETARRRLVKTASRNRIDGTAALLDAMCVRQKWAPEDGYYLANEGKK